MWIVGYSLFFAVFLIRNVLSQETYGEGVSALHGASFVEYKDNPQVPSYIRGESPEINTGRKGHEDSLDDPLSKAGNSNFDDDNIDEYESRQSRFDFKFANNPTSSRMDDFSDESDSKLAPNFEFDDDSVGTKKYAQRKPSKSPTFQQDLPRFLTPEEQAQRLSHDLRTYFWRVFKNRTNYDLANRTFHRAVKPQLKYVHLRSDFGRASSYDESDERLILNDVDETFRKWRTDIDAYLGRKVDALRKLVERAEQASSNYSVNIPSFDENCIRNYTDLRDSDNETEYSTQTVGVHMPIGVVNCSGIVQRDTAWLSDQIITKAFEANRDNDPAIFRQYISGSDSGITRIYPLLPWRLDPPDMTVDLFDPRSRHWYIRATTCPKDIMFLVDISGSVAGQTRHLMKLTVMTILTTLTPDDYINAVWYNKDVGQVISGCFDGFIPATTRNKLLIQKFLDGLVETHEADFEKALNFTYSEMSKWDNITRNYSDLQYGAGCHKLLFVLTDTVQETGHELFEKYGFSNETFDIRLFGFAMGFNTPDIETLQFLSCTRNGGYYKVDSLEDIKDESRAYLTVLSRPLALSTAEKVYEERTVAYTGPYLDAQHAGQILTISMPILNRMRGASGDRFIGVAAIDISLAALIALADQSLTSGDAYVFATDNNGNVLFHPNLYVPEPDFQMIRRAACFEATPAKRKSEADKVIYWEATEEIKMQMGLMDSMYTIDVAEVETPTDQFMLFRDHLISGQCEEADIFRFSSEKVINAGRRYAAKVQHSYRCLKLRNTPYSLALALKSRSRQPATRFTREITRRKLNFGNTSVAFIPAPRIFCDADLSSDLIVDRWLRLAETLYGTNFGGCGQEDKGRTGRLLLDYAAIEQWLNNTIWMEEDSNKSCQTARDMYIDVADLVFIQTDGGLTAFYPKCSAWMPRSFTKDPTQSEFYQYARLAPQELSITWTNGDYNKIMVYSAVHDKEHDHTLAVVGMQVSLNHLIDWWRLAHLESSSSNCWNNDGQSICYLMTRNFMVLGSTSRVLEPSPRMHLGFLEPALYEYLVNASSEKIDFTDYQDRCWPGETSRAPYIPSAAPRVFLRSLVDVAYSVLTGVSSVWSTSFWLQQWSLLSSLWSPGMIVESRLPNCDTVKPRNDEQCTMQYEMYVFKPNSSFGQDSYYNDECGITTRLAWTKIEGTNLFVIDVHIRGESKCENIIVRRRPMYPTHPKRRTQCQELIESKTLRSRRRARGDCEPFHEKENRVYDEGKCSSAIFKPSILILLLQIVISKILLSYF